MNRSYQRFLASIAVSMLVGGCVTLGPDFETPASPFARWLAQVEAVFGQLYIAILIATLVGMRIVHATSSDTRDDNLEQ